MPPIARRAHSISVFGPVHFSARSLDRDHAFHRCAVDAAFVLEDSRLLEREQVHPGPAQSRRLHRLAVKRALHGVAGGATRPVPGDRGADRNLVSIADKLAEDEFLRERRPPVTARVGEFTVPWRFLNHPLFRGIIAMPAADLLLVNQRDGDYGILLAGGVGHYCPLALRSLEMLQEFDVAPLMEGLVGEAEFAKWLTFIEGAEHRAPASGLTPTPSSKKHVVSSLPPADRGPAQQRSGVSAAGTARPTEPGPRPIDLDDLVLGHLKAFHAEIPSGEGGSATARALLLGIVNGYLRRAPSVEGTWREVLAPFVEAGDLDDMPSDKTARAALNLLKASPIVCRVDHQRWRICLDECRDPKSEVVAQLLGMYTARPR